MHATIQQGYQKFTVDLGKPLDISLGLKGGADNPAAWYLGPPVIEPVQDGNFIGKVSQGASVNFNTIIFNPHAHGTHTECVGHITREFHSVNQSLISFFFTARLISVSPEERHGDQVISAASLRPWLARSEVEALVLRTLPNGREKRRAQYSHSNWPYLTWEAAQEIRRAGVQHLLIDLPSVDKEKDEGRLLAHKAFWNYPEAPRFGATITEFIYVPDHLEDGQYLLNLQVAPFENDASPSRPVLYRILEQENFLTGEKESMG